MYAMHKASKMSAAKGKARLCDWSAEDVAVAVGETVLLEGAMVVVKIGLARRQSKMPHLNTDGGVTGV